MWTIIVAERGWIYAGRLTREGDKLKLADAYVVRRFSLNTQDGLGMLAERAPKKDNDVLDPAPRGVGVFVFSVVADFECNQDTWTAWHKAQAKKVSK